MGFTLKLLMRMKKNTFSSPQTHVDGKKVLEKFHSVSSGLYVTSIRVIESHSVNIPKVIDPKLLSLWHERLGHPGVSMMRRIVENSVGHPLKTQKIIPQDELHCSACSFGKLIVRPSKLSFKPSHRNS